VTFFILHSALTSVSPARDSIACTRHGKEGSWARSRSVAVCP
jgi:hypothetical protein